MKLKLILTGVSLLIVALIGVGVYFFRHSSAPKTQSAASDVSWHLEKGGVWVASGAPPACPNQPIFTMPVDINLVTAILYPGQIRGDAYKPQGGFRASDQTVDNKITVTVPLDATITRGSRAFRNGENQYSFEFVNSCGIWYSLGHLLVLDPKFLAIANLLPLIDDDKDGFHTTQIYDVTPPVAVKAGEILATAVGYAKQHSVFFDWGVLDLRHTNGFTISPDWAAKYGSEFDRYAVCGIEMLPPTDTARLKALHSGTVESGTRSDYCQ